MVASQVGLEEFAGPEVLPGSLRKEGGVAGLTWQFLLAVTSGHGRKRRCSELGTFSSSLPSCFYSHLMGRWEPGGGVCFCFLLGISAAAGQVPLPLLLRPQKRKEDERGGAGLDFILKCNVSLCYLFFCVKGRNRLALQVGSLLSFAHLGCIPGLIPLSFVGGGVPSIQS